MRPPAVLLLVLVLLAPAAAPATGASDGSAFPSLELREGAWWRYVAANATGSAADGGSGTAVRVVDRVEAEGREAWVVETRQRVNRTLDNGSITETTVTRLTVTVGELRVLQRETVHVRDGSFRGVPVFSYQRNLTRYDPGLPLVPLRAGVGDTWRDEVRARSTVNRTTVVQQEDGSRRVQEGPRTYEETVVQVLTLGSRGNERTPAGRFPVVTVNRTIQGQPGWTVERWSGDANYMVGWANRNATGAFAGGAVLVAQGVDAPPEEGGSWWLWVLGGVAVAAVTGGALWWRRRRGEPNPDVDMS